MITTEVVNSQLSGDTTTIDSHIEGDKIRENILSAAIQLWDERLAEFREIVQTDSEIEVTDIGEGFAANPENRAWRFGDGTLVPRVVDLKKKYGRVPKVLFLTANTSFANELSAFNGLCAAYKEQGVERIIAILGGIHHERQDHEFKDEVGRPMPQPIMLKHSIKTLAQYVDAGLIIQPHSLWSVEYGLQEDLPLLPIDALDYLVNESELKKVKSPFSMGPDRGRRDEGKRVAALLDCPFYSADKTRDRKNWGKPTIIIPQDIKDLLKQLKATLIPVDDEIREGGTIEELTTQTDGYVNEIIIVVVRPILAQGHEKSAVDHLSNPLITRIITTDTVQPLKDITPIKHKLEIYPIGGEVEKLIDYLRSNLTSNSDQNWLIDPKVIGSQLHLDIGSMQYDLSLRRNETIFSS